MSRFISTKKMVGLSIFATLLLFAFSGSHPTTGSGGYTGAPGDNVCTTCHTPSGSIDGTIEFSGIPTTVDPNTTYPITVTITSTAGSPTRAGFQMVSLKTNLANGGTFSVPGSENNAQVKTAGGKSYVGHQPAKTFTGNTVVYNVDWTAPASATGDITIYGASILGSGSSGNSLDKFVLTNQSVTLGGGGNPLSGTFTNIIDASCSDSNDGSATINASGGSGNYSYNWDNGESNATAIMLTAGLHSVTVTDDANAEIVETVTIGAPDPLVPMIVSQSDAVCNGENTGMAELNTTGGSPGFFYDWGNGITGSIQNNLAAGNYNVTITDINGCTTNINVTIDQPDLIDINILLLDEPACNGDDNGTISVEATGGNGNFTYNWLDGIGVADEGTLSFIPAGDYQLEVLDGEFCTTQTTITLGEPEPVTSTATGVDVLCFGDASGSATAAGEGGNGGFTYEWSNGGTGATQNDLIAGTYTVTVSDSDACTSESTIEIMQPVSSLEAGITIIEQPNCGNQDGELSAFGLGGTPDYSYLWEDNTTSPILSNLSSGTYTITVTDQNNCTAEFSIILEDNDGVTLAANDVQNNECPGGSEGAATISASGGTGMYSYSWSNGGSNATETNLIAGNYTITVTDESNCTGEITIEITEPDAFLANETITNITCNGAENGSIQLDPSGGTGDLTYAWNTGGTGDVITDLIPGIFSVTITDDNNCTGEIEFVITEPDPIITGDILSNTPSCPGDMDGMITIDPSGGTGSLSYLWSTGDTTISISGIAAGDYALTITDGNDCEVNFDFTLDDASEIVLTETITSPTCSNTEDGSVSIGITGGSGNYVIEWSTGDTSLTVDNLTGGTYSITVTDGNECTAEQQIVVIAPPEIDPNVMTMDESSNGENDGSATADPMNGNAPYSFLWSTGDTTEMIENLAPGSYDLTITDANGCTVEETVVINSGDCNIESDVDIQDISCFGLNDGTITVTLTGAVNPISYIWNTDATTAGISNLGTGVYSVTITDANNCQIQIIEIAIAEPDEIIATDAIINDASGEDNMDGSIEIEFSGGTGDLMIDYTDGDGMDIGITSFENLLPGSYGAIVTDENGCEVFFGPYMVGILSNVEDFTQIQANIYPIPAKSFFTIETNDNLIASPVIYSLSGQKINSQFEKSANKYIFYTSNIANGVYFIKLVSDTDITLKKVIITH